MPNPAERFIDAAVSPLAENAELEIAARNELHEILSANEEGPGDSLDTAAARLERTARRPIGRWVRIALYTITALASMVALDVVRRSQRLARDLAGYLAIVTPGAAAKPEDFLAKSLSAEQRFQLLGDTGKRLKSDRIKALWESAPENPAYFAEYTLYHLRDHDRMPPDFLATAMRLDPDNAWFSLMEASTLAKGAIDKAKLTPKERKAGVLPSYRILDATRYRQAVDLVLRAGAQPRFDSYQARLLAGRIPLLPQRTDFLSQVVPMSYLAALPADTIKFRNLMDAVDARTAELAAAGDQSGFRQLAGAWENCLIKWSVTEGHSLVDVLVLKVGIQAAAQRFERTARELGLAAEEARWAKIARWMEDQKEARERQPYDSTVRMRGGLFAGLSTPAVRSQFLNAPQITEQELKPGRMADHEFFSRIFSAVVWLALGLMAVAAALYPLRASLLVRRLSQRCEALMRPVDWLWVLGGGILLPFVFYQVIYRLTPWGGRDWSIAASGFIVPSGQFSAAGWLMIVMPVLIARWRLGIRGAVLGFGARPAWLAWGGVILGALSIPAFGLALTFERSSELGMIVAGILLGALQLVWLATGMRALFGRNHHLLRRATLSRVMVPAYVSGMLLMIVSMPFYHAAEKRWLAQDRLMEVTPESPSWTRYEYDVARAMRKELHGLLAP